MNSSKWNTPAKLYYKTLLIADKNNKDIEHGVVRTANSPDSSQRGINIKAPPIPTIAPINPARKAELANFYIS